MDWMGHYVCELTETSKLHMLQLDLLSCANSLRQLKRKTVY